MLTSCPWTTFGLNYDRAIKICVHILNTEIQTDKFMDGKFSAVVLAESETVLFSFRSKQCL